MDFWVQKEKCKMIKAHCKQLRREKQTAKRYKIVIRRIKENIDHMHKELNCLNGAKKMLTNEISKILEKTSYAMKYKKDLMKKLAIVEIRISDVTKIISEMQDDLKMVRDSNREVKANIKSGKGFMKIVS